MIKIDIIIPHFGDVLPLKNAINALTQLPSISFINKIIVVENGPLSGAKEVCEHNDKATIEHIYTPVPGLSNARNLGIKHSDADYLIFFDNDLGFADSTLEGYFNAFSDCGQEYFYGGPVEPVYETDPPEWKLKFVPPSVKGFSQGDTNFISDSAEFLGGNHALSRKSICELQEHFGSVYEGESATGKDGGGVGEEHRLQRKLLTLGFKSCYVADAKVYHPVPQSCLTHEWICNRRFRRGITDASNQKMFESRFKIKGIPFWVWRKFIVSRLIEKVLIKVNPHIALKWGVQRAWSAGVKAAHVPKTEKGSQ
ncbi:glycosyltransferase family 2 protein [Alteromonas antoniana]|uniref:glycosyltransferase family 2 protein n=1 Tax=Alteromonas antoniana TaxID=2803813 RepID=UPI001C48138D|nr:glycosyltransferase family 2 protein [Alteromonas antoniana]